jgi:hypothetical protein
MRARARECAVKNILNAMQILIVRNKIDRLVTYVCVVLAEFCNFLNGVGSNVFELGGDLAVFGGVQ